MKTKPSNLQKLKALDKKWWAEVSKAEQALKAALAKWGPIFEQLQNNRKEA